MLACADVEEGVTLRSAGVRVPILVLGALSISGLDGVFEHSLTPTVSTPAAARALAKAAAARSLTIGCHIKIDTGMNRLGFLHENLARTMPEVLCSPGLRVEAIYTHFASAEVTDTPLFEVQRTCFERALAALVAMGHLAPLKRHAANSAALLRDEGTWYDWVRPGLLLYGIVPPPLAGTILALRPALSLQSRIVAIKGIRAGEGAGYGWRWTTDKPRTIAIVPAGYADGLDTRLGGRGFVLVRGRRVPIVGAVSMNMMTIDVTGLGATPGDEVVLIGKQGEEEITVGEMAAIVGTIPWEVLCRIGAQTVRQYVD